MNTKNITDISEIQRLISKYDPSHAKQLVAEGRYQDAVDYLSDGMCLVNAWCHGMKRKGNEASRKHWSDSLQGVRGSSTRKKLAKSTQCHRQICDFDLAKGHQLEAEGLHQLAVDHYNEGFRLGEGLRRELKREQDTIDKKNWSPLLDTLITAN